MSARCFTTGLDTFDIGDPYRKLDQEPMDYYGNDIEALGRLVGGEYDDVLEAAQSMSPRTAHEVFRDPYLRQEPARVSEGQVDEIVEVLDDLSEFSRSGIGEELFNLGYNWREPFIDLDKAVKQPYMNHRYDNFPERPRMFDNPFSQGKRKRESDKFYSMAVGQMFEDIQDWDIVIE